MSRFNPIGVTKNINALAKKYNYTLLDKNIKYVYINTEKGGRNGSIILAARAHNFMHLCGVDRYQVNEPTKRMKDNPESVIAHMNRGRNSVRFFQDALAGTLEPEKIIIKNKFYKEKISSLNALSELISGSAQVCDKRGNYYHSKFDRSIRTKKSILALGLKEQEHQASQKYSGKTRFSSDTKVTYMKTHIPITNVFLKYNQKDSCFKSNTKLLHIFLLNEDYTEKEVLYSINQRKHKKK